MNVVMCDGIWSKETVDDPNDRKLVRKLDLHLIPGITLLYLLNYLDRVNIGQAKLNGITTSLNLSSAQYNACLSVVYVTYVAFEVLSNLILKKLRPSRWIPLIMVTWGIATTLAGLANSYGALLACRLLLGAPETGLFAGKYQLTIRMCSFSEHGNDTSLTVYNQNDRALFKCYLLSVELV
jgi:sugar phosphate permease